MNINNTWITGEIVRMLAIAEVNKLKLHRPAIILDKELNAIMNDENVERSQWNIVTRAESVYFLKLKRTEGIKWMEVLDIKCLQTRNGDNKSLSESTYT